ncbi:TPA: hypothetical protein QIB48_000371 [Morganella morganii subsp. morganii]|uniref:hypothetical protein n=1 Tax=Morganella morganii TaxID=582 RepID=UPI001BD94B2F|nr:hypothetical protein [Morganella morganii]MBT0362604.1 hypothetical protein [Morganella morganii subsp. morganii]HDT0623966.1 hypothetical protein [Morganella morganii subsp. morganii]
MQSNDEPNGNNSDNNKKRVAVMMVSGWDFENGCENTKLADKDDKLTLFGVT